MNIAERTKSEYSPLEIDVQIGIRDVHSQPSTRYQGSTAAAAAQQAVDAGQFC